MSIGKQEELQGTLWLSYDQLPKSMGHAFYDRLQRLLRKGQFDSFAEKLCEPYYAKGKGRPSVPPGRYFRMLFVGYFEGIDSERGICWRCADSLSLREFLRPDIKQAVPDHSSLSRIRSRLPIEILHEIFLFVLKLLAEAKLVHGKRLGIDASTMDATEAQKNRIRDIAEQLDVHRKTQQALFPKLPLTAMYGVLKKSRAGEPLSVKERKVADQAGLQELQRLQNELDTAVADAYGWPDGLEEQEVLKRLLELNGQREAEEKMGMVRRLRSNLQGKEPKLRC